MLEALSVGVEASAVEGVVSGRLHHFLLNAEGGLERVRNATFDNLIAQTARLPDYEGQTVRIAEVIAEVDEKNVPVSIISVRGSYIEFDADGLFDLAASSSRVAQVMSLKPPAKDAPVVDLKSAREERSRHWEPTPAERSAIVTAVLGHPRSTPNVTTERVDPDELDEMKATQKKRALSWKARQALEEIQSSLQTIFFKLNLLREEDLEGFAEAALEAGANWSDGAEPLHWQAIAAGASRRLEIARAYNSGLGEWYAVVEGFKRTSECVSEMLFANAAKFPTRDEAIVALKGMLAEASEKLTHGVSIDARTVPALEWDEDDTPGRQLAKA